MPEAVTKTINTIMGKWNGLDKTQRLRIILSVAVILISAVVAIVFVTNPNYTKLVTGSVNEIGEMSKTLTEANIVHKVTDNSTTIMVKEKDKDSAEITLAQSGLLKDGLKFEDSLDLITYSTTESDKKKIYQEYYEGKLAEKLMKMANIENAIVTFNVPDKSVFLKASEEDVPTATVMITPKSSLTTSQIDGIIKMVASSVERLDEDHVTIVDNTGNVLNEKDDFGVQGISSKQLEIQAQKKKEIERQLGTLLSALTDDVIVMAHVVCDFDQETIDSVTYTTPIPDSDTGLLRSQQTSKENLQNMDNGYVPGTESNQGTGAELISTGTGGTYTKNETTSNYELNQENKTTIKGLGNIDPSLSSVTVNMLYGVEFLEAPSEENIENITKMVHTATGIDTENITVASFKVTPKTQQEVQLPIDWGEIIEKYAGYLAAIIIILILVVFILKLKSGSMDMEDMVLAGEPGAAFNATVGPEEEGTIKELDNNSEVKQQINKFIEKQPDIAAGMLRNWIYENDKN
ncbi:MAG: flagellar M-ring protein FliF [Clostridia bacterium]|nr:flagellar M-ring protein FliF [Clostridia bacterium]